MIEFRRMISIVEGASVGEISRSILHAGTVLYHGTDVRPGFSIPRSPAWFSLSRSVAMRWAGWRSSDHKVGKRRVLAFRATRDIELYDITKPENHYRLAALFDPDNEPEDASPWTLAANLKGADGWIGDGEVMLRDTTGLEFINAERVPPTVKSFGDA